jgi:hypothetical protein
MCHKCKKVKDDRCLECGAFVFPKLGNSPWAKFWTGHQPKEIGGSDKATSLFKKQASMERYV